MGKLTTGIESKTIWFAHFPQNISNREDSRKKYQKEKEKDYKYVSRKSKPKKYARTRRNRGTGEMEMEKGVGNAMHSLELIVIWQIMED